LINRINLAFEHAAGQLAFNLVVTRFTDDNGDKQQLLLSNIPDDVLKFISVSLHEKLVTSNLILQKEAESFILMLGHKVLSHQLSKHFFYPEYLPFNEKISDNSLQKIIRLQMGFLVDHREFFSANNNQLKYYTLRNEFLSLYHTSPTNFQKTFKKITRSQFEAQFDGDFIDHEYVSNYNKDSCFYSCKGITSYFYIQAVNAIPDLMIATSISQTQEQEE